MLRPGEPKQILVRPDKNWRPKSRCFFQGRPAVSIPEVERSEALAVFVESGGHPCRTVARTFFQGEDAKGNVFWNVACAGGESYVVVIKNDVPGSTRVMSCRRLRAVAGADCFKKLE